MAKPATRSKRKVSGRSKRMRENERPAISAVPELDRVIHEPMRLGIMSALAVNEKLAFKELKRVLSATDGNLSVHARKLEESGYLTCIKSFQGRTPLTEFKITTKGAAALKKYLAQLEAVIAASKGGS